MFDIVVQRETITVAGSLANAADHVSNDLFVVHQSRHFLRVTALCRLDEQRERVSRRCLIAPPPEEETGNSQNNHDENEHRYEREYPGPAARLPARCGFTGFDVDDYSVRRIEQILKTGSFPSQLSTVSTRVFSFPFSSRTLTASPAATAAASRNGLPETSCAIA